MPPNQDDGSRAEALRRILDAVDGMTTDEIRSLTRTFMSGDDLLDPALPGTAKRPDRRRPRREDVVTYRMRVTLKDTKPPVWRRLEVASDVHLDELHEILQVAFGWTDSHLHRFVLGTSAWDATAQLFLCPFDVEEGENDGLPEQDVRLDEVLGSVGDRLLYLYDYGDGWEHVLQLQAVLDRGAGAPPAVCSAGRRAGPPEDCGGPYGFEELVAQGVIDDDLDLPEINTALSAIGGPESAETDGAPATHEGRLADLLRTVPPPIRRFFAPLLDAARLDEPVDLTADELTPMVRPFAWLLEHVGEDGVNLTSAGYLPPASVSAAFTALGFEDEWIGEGNRESHTLPVLQLRRSAMHLGLLRVHKERLLLTTAARGLASDPVALARHIGNALPIGPPDSLQQHAGFIVMLGLAAGQDVTDEVFHEDVAEVLTDMGWAHRGPDHEPLDVWDARDAATDTLSVLQRLRCFDDTAPLPHTGPPTPAGVRFARAALTRR